MRTHTILTAAIAVTLFALSTLGVHPAFAQTPDPVVGVQYDLTNVGSIKLHGATVDYDRPIHDDYVRLAAGGAFGTSEMLNEVFAGAGPGVRLDTGALQIYAHALFGYRRSGGYYGQGGGFDARFGAGIDYPLGRSHSFRAGAAYGGDAHHVTAGMSFRF